MPNTPVVTSKIANSCELASVLSNNENITRGLLCFARHFNVSVLLKPFSGVKTKGTSFIDLLLLMCIARLKGDSIYSQVCKKFGGLFQGDKNVFYRLQNNSRMDWRKLLLSFAKQFRRVIKQKGNGNTGIPCFIIDDSVLEKTGKTIEGLGRVFDHITRRAVLGYKFLLLGYWDGQSFLGIDFSLHRELGKVKDKPYGMKKKEIKNQFHKKRAKEHPSSTRRKELDMDKIEMALQMIKRAVKHGFEAQYVLFDSWFMCEGLLAGIRSIRGGLMHVIGMCRMDRRKYLYDGKEMTATEMVVRYARKRTKYSRKHKMHYLPVTAMYKGTLVRMYFTRYGQRANWHLIISTNLKLGFIETIEIYQIRWTIEVTFKECKQYLGIGNCQNTDFDGQIADCTLVLVTHTILSLEKRFSAYETMGGLYEILAEELRMMNLWERLWKIFQQLVKELVTLLDIDVEETMQKLIANDKATEKLQIILRALQDEEENLSKAA